MRKLRYSFALTSSLTSKQAARPGPIEVAVRRFMSYATASLLFFGNGRLALRGVMAPAHMVDMMPPLA